MSCGGGAKSSAPADSESMSSLSQEVGLFTSATEYERRRRREQEVYRKSAQVTQPLVWEAERISTY